MQKLYNETNVQNIADAIRDRIGYERNNLFSLSNATLIGNDVNKIDNNSYSVLVTSTWKGHVIVKCNVEKNTDYFFQWEAKGTYSANSFLTKILGVQTNTNVSNGYYFNYQKSFNSGENTEVLVDLYAIGNGFTTEETITLYNIMLSKGTKKAAYEPYDLKYKIREMAGAIKELPGKKMYEKALANQVSAEETGTEVYLEGSADMPFKKLEVQGNTEQESYEGYNLLDFNVAQTSSLVKINSDGTITLNGVCKGVTLKFKEITLIQNQTYKTKIILVSGSYTGPKENEMGVLHPLGKNVYLKNNIFDEYTLTENRTRNQLWLSENFIYNNAVFKIYTYDGIDEKPYEPYVGGTASPNPEYPQEIKCVGQNGSASVKVQNRNFFDNISNQMVSYSGCTCKSNGQYFIIDGTTDYNAGQRSFRITGKYSGANYPSYISTDEKDCIYLESGSYTLSCKSISGSHNANKLGIQIVKLNPDKIMPNISIGLCELNQSSTFTLGAGYYYLAFNAGVSENHNTFNNLTIAVQFEQGSTATPYVEHQEQNFTVPVQQEMCKIGDVKDRFVKQDGKWYEEHNSTKEIFDGSEEWGYLNNAFVIYRPYIKIETTETNIIVLSSHFKGLTTRYRGALTINGIAKIIGNNEQIGIKTEHTKVVEFKKWLSEYKPEIYYQLEIPELIECTEEQTEILNKLQEALTYQGNTHVSATSENANPILDVEYFIDKDYVQTAMLNAEPEI